MDYLVFQLYGVLASWGTIAVGETRHSLYAPTKSSIMGLLAAAMGIKHEEEECHLALNDNCEMAVKVFSHGSLLSDFHTTQVPNSVGKYSYRSRRDELVIGKQRLGTVLSRREYRQDAFVLVAIKVKSNSIFKLPMLKSHLDKPKFTLYLGRKSCPLSAPLAATIISVPSISFKAALDAYPIKGLYQPTENISDLINEKKYLNLEQTYYLWEGGLDALAADVVLDKSRLQTHQIPDQLLSRKRWQFQTRPVHVYYEKQGGC